MTLCKSRAYLVAAFLCLLSTRAFAQRELHWDAMQVVAHLDAGGHLQVAETQTMVFTGDWNGGERTFNIRPRQKLTFNGIYRDTGSAWRPLHQDRSLTSVDSYAWTDNKTLRWRSRRPTDPLFNHTSLRYELRYDLSGVLQKNGDGFRLDHDFAFPDRVGAINNFELRFTLDSMWQPSEPIRDVYTVSNLLPGRSFVLTLPLRYTGVAVPAVLDTSVPLEIWLGVLAIFGATLLAVGAFFVREQSNGRFDPLQQEDQINESWLKEHVLNHPAEVVGAAWDDRIGRPEVVALLARMTTEGKLESQPSPDGSHSSMTLHLKVDRSRLTGYERKIVDGLFFDDRTTTTTDDVKQHYKKQGFSPVAIIQKDLETAVREAFPLEASRRFSWETLLVFLFGLAMLFGVWSGGYASGPILYMVGLGSIMLAAISTLPGYIFRSRVDWGRVSAVICLIPAFVIAGAAAVILWYLGVTGIVELPFITVVAVVALAIGLINTSINSLKSRESRAGLAIRKKLAAARAFFMAELRQRRPALRDEWSPWILAFGLSREMDEWSARGVSASTTGNSFGTTTSSSHSSNTWTGFGGGRSGGGGGGASWVAAASGLAAGVAAPSSGGSGGGGGGGGGSSGGGGGGGW
jgi:hypothetical protein